MASDHGVIRKGQNLEEMEGDRAAVGGEVDVMFIDLFALV